MEIMSLVSSDWELIDPNPDIYALFAQFNKQFFWDKLHSVEVKWSSRMTLCAGLCRYERRAGYCSISLSVPLLKLRPRKDLVETLLIFHSFHAEVNLYKQHWWRCTGTCTKRPPFYGFVKRSMNRAPGPNDIWWEQHKTNCSGVFIKVKEPEGYGEKSKKNKNEIRSKTSSRKTKTTIDIRKFFSPNKKDTSKNLNGRKSASSPNCSPSSHQKKADNSNNAEAGGSAKMKMNANQKKSPNSQGHLLGGTHTGVSRLLTELSSTSRAGCHKRDEGYKKSGNETKIGNSDPKEHAKKNCIHERIETDGDTQKWREYKPEKTNKPTPGLKNLKIDTRGDVIKRKSSDTDWGSLENRDDSETKDVSKYPKKLEKNKQEESIKKNSSLDNSKRDVVTKVTDFKRKSSFLDMEISIENNNKMEVNNENGNLVKFNNRKQGGDSEIKRKTKMYILDSESDDESEVTGLRKLISIQTDTAIYESKVSCPVCNQSILENVINAHLDLCIKNDEKDENEIMGDFADDTEELWDVVVVSDENETFYPCPVCGEQVLALDMNTHLNSCVT
ncbi:DNA-dependent metalloprotease SPRTN-like isoform X2 [Artemia franciscana]|uniref:Protein with SprT-like domain at the N terminus n=1 Tax=Artemia franciscana TaxID=6661 RepID=A0AA88LLX4_ARTSF|nr:hypothetical protein QYM36_007825 [Artemia franciscana]KAK2727110.1 hypothetical protein QYM36_007825 [Artemia franciscana]